MMEKTQLLTEVLFEDRNGQYVPRHPKLKRVVYGLVGSLSTVNSFKEAELIGSAFSIAWEALHTFELRDGANWNDVISGSDPHNLNRAVLTISRKLEHELPTIANPDTKRLYDPQTGGKSLVTVNFTSLDRDIYNGNGDWIGCLGDEVTESFFAPAEQAAAPTPFLAWFRNNRHSFLTPRQNELLDALSSMTLAKDTDYVDESNFAELTGMQPRDLDRFKKRIRQRTLAAWGDKGSGRREAYLAQQIESLQGFIDIAESDAGLAQQNERLAQWLLANDERVSDLVYDDFAGDLKATRAFAEFMGDKVATLESSLIYRIYDVIETEIERLKAEQAREAEMEVPGRIRSTEMTTELAERLRKYEAFKQPQPCRVYNAGGELRRELEAVGKAYVVRTLDAFGNWLEQ